MNAHDAKKELHLIKGPYRERLSQHPAELMANRRVLALDIAIAAIDQQRELERLLSEWFEGWNEGSHPSGDLLDDTEHALGYAPKSEAT